MKDININNADADAEQLIIKQADKQGTDVMNDLEEASSNELLPIFFEPIFIERVWGGTAMRDKLGLEFPFEKVGECWAISDMPGYESIAKTGKYCGQTLKQIFKGKMDKFPILIKIIDATDDLSVQVHPNDEYAAKNENSPGKTECWYILETAGDNADIVYGHTAQNRLEMEKKIAENKWNEFINCKQINTDDFIFVEAGKIHAIKKGTLLMEIQQSSDVTYRLYDYDRIDASGQKRELHIDKALDVTMFPDHECEFKSFTGDFGGNAGVMVTTLADSEQFTVKKYDIDNTEFALPTSGDFAIVLVVSGEGMAGMSAIRRGDIFLTLTEDDKHMHISGKLAILVVTAE